MASNGQTPVTLSSATAYATKRNIVAPFTSARAAVNEAQADARIEDSLPSGSTVAGLSIEKNGESSG